jgi:hypothetical protein
MQALGDDMLKGEGRMCDAKSQPNWIVHRIAHPGGVLQLLLICILDKALYHDVGMKAADCHPPRTRPRPHNNVVKHIANMILGKGFWGGQRNAKRNAMRNAARNAKWCGRPTVDRLA